MRIVCSLVSVTVMFQLELFIILNVNYRNVCSSNRPQLRVLPGSSISAPWRVDFRNWQVDYCVTPMVECWYAFWQWVQVTMPYFIIDVSFTGQQVMKFVCMCFHMIEIFYFLQIQSRLSFNVCKPTLLSISA